jgi:hypothetical protein
MGRKAVAPALLLAALVAMLGAAPAPALASSEPRFASAHAAVAHYGPDARKRLAPAFRSAGVAYPPRKVVLAAIKGERVLEVYAAQRGALHYITSYRIRGMSGHAGPKLREGDRQVPEGVYRISTLNTNTSFHLAMLLDYPNAFDRAQGRKDGRSNLGGSINIHGGNRSTGCLAMGDATAEDLFVLAADTGLKNVKVVIAPSDPRTGALKPRWGAPSWTPSLYSQIAREFGSLPRSPEKVAESKRATGGAAFGSAGPISFGARALELPATDGWATLTYSAVLGVLLLGALGLVLAVRRRRRASRFR